MSETMGAPGAMPQAIDSARPRRIAEWGGGAAIATVVAGFVIGQLVALGIIVAGGGIHDAPTAVVAIAMAVADVIALGIVVAVAARGAERLAPSTLGIRRTRFWPAVGWTAAIYFGVNALIAIWALVIGGVHARGHETSNPSATAAIAGILAIAVIAPIVEEIAFRGYLFPALTRWRGPWIGALITALIFGAAHFAVYPAAFLPALAVFGFGACLLYWFTGSLLPSIAFHALNNGLAISIAFGWSWQVPLTALGAVIATQLLVAPFAHERAPEKSEMQAA